MRHPQFVDARMLAGAARGSIRGVTAKQISGQFLHYLRGALVTSKEAIKRNRTMREILYGLSNREIFSDLYWHEKMLSDTSRIEAYRAGLRKHVKAGDVVFDLGTGTGILSLLASLSRPKVIYAIEHSSFISVAKDIALRNGVGCIEFVHSNSRDFVPPERGDVIIHEQMGQLIFGENMIANLLDLKARALKPGGKILPGLFKLFIEPAVLRDQYRIPFIWEIPGLEFDLGHLKANPQLDEYKPARYQLRDIANFEVEALLGQPQPLLEFDLNAISGEADIPRRFDVRREVLHDGQVDGLVAYFEAGFDESVGLTTSPLQRQTNWRNVLFRMPARKVRRGDKLDFSVSLPDLCDFKTWKVELK
jgi:protein arginine N-methyltransferase 1